MEEVNKNPTAGFSDREIIKKFHWLQENGMTIDQAAETIKEQTNDCYVLRYIESYTSARASKK